MLPASAERILEEAEPNDVILDVGGWASPFRRANWVLDLMPHETRGLYGPELGGEREYFSPETWVQLDICDHTPWPFEDDQFDFVLCAHTLEDVRDPLWVCAELQRVGKAGYIEVPSRLEEQTYGVQGPWVGWGHHHWLTDRTGDGLEFVFKHHIIHGQPQSQFPAGFLEGVPDEARVLSFWWQGSFPVSERLFYEPGSLDTYLADFVAENISRGAPPAKRRRGLLRRR